jgi:hypothetical protein
MRIRWVGMFLAWERRIRHAELWLENLRDHEEHVRVDERLILKQVLRKRDWKVCVGFSRL